MAEAKKDAKKDDKKDAKKGGGGFGFEEVLLLIFGLITIFFVTIPRLENNPQTDSDTSKNGITDKTISVGIRNFYDALLHERKIDDTTVEPSLLDQAKFRTTDLIQTIFYICIIVSIFFSILFWIFKNLFSFKLKVVKEEYEKTLGITKVQDAEHAPDIQPVPQGYVPDTNGIQNPKWDMIEAYARSGNQAELRLAIIEADIMLFDILKQSGFIGTTVGDMLKNTNKSQLATLDYAWKAHRVRNELAHQGSNFVLGRTDAEAALDGYKKVFTELNLI